MAFATCRVLARVLDVPRAQFPRLLGRGRLVGGCNGSFLTAQLSVDSREQPDPSILPETAHNKLSLAAFKIQTVIYLTSGCTRYPTASGLTARFRRLAFCCKCLMRACRESPGQRRLPGDTRFEGFVLDRCCQRRAETFPT